MNVAGRTALARATLSAIPVHKSIAIGLSPWAVQQIDKRRRAFIWCGDLTVVGGKCKGLQTTWCGGLAQGRNRAQNSLGMEAADRSESNIDRPAEQKGEDGGRNIRCSYRVHHWFR